MNRIDNTQTLKIGKSYFNLSICIVYITILIPSSIKVLSISLFDIALLPIIVLTIFKFLIEGIRRLKLNKIEYIIIFILASNIFNYIAKYQLQDENSFLQSVSLNADFIYIRLCIYAIVTIITILIVYMIGKRSSLDSEKINILLKHTFIAGIINSSINLFTWAFSTNLSFARYNWLPPISGSNGIHINLMILINLISLLYIFINRLTNNKNDLLALSCFTLSLFNIVLIVSRLAWMQYYICIILTFILLGRRFNLRSLRRYFIYINLLIFCLIGLLSILNSDVQVFNLFKEAFQAGGNELNQGSWLMRFSLYQKAFNIFLENSIFGCGYGHYILYSTASIFFQGLELNVSSPHNGLLTIMSEQGIVGIFLISSLFIIITSILYKLYLSITNIKILIIIIPFFSYFLVQVLSHLIANSTIIPLPGERDTVSFAIFIWLNIGLITSLNSSNSKFKKL